MFLIIYLLFKLQFTLDPTTAKQLQQKFYLQQQQRPNSVHVVPQQQRITRRNSLDLEKFIQVRN